MYQLFNVKTYWHNIIKFDKVAKKPVKDKELWILGLTNNPNFLCAYMVICLSYTFGLIIDTKKVFKIVIYVLFAALFMFVLLISNTTSGIVGLTCVFAYILIYCIKNKEILKLVVVLSIVINVTCITIMSGKTQLLKDLQKTSNETIEITKGNIDDTYGTKRVYIWKNTMQIVPKYIWHGVGIDSFHKAFDGQALTLKTKYKTILYDKVHNEYLQILITEGIFALVSYLILYGYASIYGMRNSFKRKEIYLILPVIGYLVQAFFNISVIEVAPIFWITLGLCCSNIDTTKIKVLH